MHSMQTLLWERPTQFNVETSGQHRLSQYRWTDDIRVDQRKVYRIVVDGSDEAMEKLLSLPSIQEAEFGFRALRKPVKMRIGGYEYNLYSIKKGHQNDRAKY